MTTQTDEWWITRWEAEEAEDAAVLSEGVTQ